MLIFSGGVSRQGADGRSEFSTYASGQHGHGVEIALPLAVCNPTAEAAGFAREFASNFGLFDWGTMVEDLAAQLVGQVVERVAIVDESMYWRPAVTLRLRWTSRTTVVIEAWDVHESNDRALRGPAYRYFRMARLRVRDAAMSANHPAMTPPRSVHATADTHRLPNRSGGW
ncbi:hypothetical protein [Nocardia sp. NPDC052566]|uniref:hypothetical protein n=1 Tax=Nocardia sp. NPDC052566 TaxID=3364330 RepID=UPI0037C7EC20